MAVFRIGVAIPRSDALLGMDLSDCKRRYRAFDYWVDCAARSGEPVTEIDAPFQPPESFRCETGRDGDGWWVRPIGELDLDTSPRLDEELQATRAAGAGRLVLDLRAVTFMDSTGLRLVIQWDKAARDEGFEFAIVPGPEVVQRVFRLTGMDQQLPVAEPPAGAGTG
jgi:anti-sigma B factor antagonist